MLIHNSEDIFSADRSPEMIKELSILKNGIVNTPIYFKTEIIISYLKDHCIKNDWITANPGLVELMLAGNFNTRNIESVFETCRTKPTYRKDYETYIRTQLLKR